MPLLDAPHLPAALRLCHCQVDVAAGGVQLLEQARHVPQVEGIVEPASRGSTSRWVGCASLREAEVDWVWH